MYSYGDKQFESLEPSKWKDEGAKFKNQMDFRDRPTSDEQIDIAEDETHFYKIIAEYQDKWLKVVVNKMNNIIITAYFDRNKKGK